MRKKILLIGSNGFIGKKLNKHLKKTYSIYKINRKVIKENTKNISCDISNIDKLKKKITKLPKFEYIINLSGQIQKSKSEMLKNIYIGNKNIIQCFNNINTIIVFFSSTLVYGHSKNYRNIKSILKPHSDYARIKVQTEGLYKKMAKNFLIFRVANVYDDKLKKKGLLGNLKKAVKKDKFVKINNMNSIRNYIHVDDLIRMVKVIFDKKIQNETLNIGHQNISNKRMIEVFEKIFKKKVRFENLNKNFYYDPNIKIDNRNIIKRLRFKFNNNLEKTIKYSK